MKVGLTFDVRGGWDGQDRKPAPGKRDAVRGDQTAARESGLSTLATDDAEEEYDSPATIDALADVLRGFGNDVELLGNGPTLLKRLLAGDEPDIIFNIAEGRGIGRSREARVPAALEMLGIPYTGSDPLCLSVALDKDCAKRLVAQAGVPTPRWILVDETASDLAEEARDFAWPLVVKPAFEGSSKGVRATSLVRDPAELQSAVREMHSLYRQPILVEEYIEGEELTVGLVGNPPEVLGIMRVIPRDSAGPFLYSLEAKRDWENRVRYECPAQLSPGATQAVEAAAFACWKALGCRDVARVDFRLRGETPFFLEANPLPGLSPINGDLVLMGREIGVSHSELVRRILNAALERNGL